MASHRRYYLLAEDEVVEVLALLGLLLDLADDGAQVLDILIEFIKLVSLSTWWWRVLLPP